MADLSLLSLYLEGQADLGTDKVFLDEPWTLSKVSMQMKPLQRVNLSSPSFKSDNLEINSSPKRNAQLDFVDSPTKIVIPKTSQVIPSAYEHTLDLNSFYDAQRAEKIYAKVPFAKGEGKFASPKLMLVLYAPKDNFSEKPYLNTEEGSMIERLFASLKVDSSDIFLTYFSKKSVTRAVPPLVATVLKKMLEKEVSLVAPEFIIFFGEKLLKQALSQSSNLNSFGGTPLEFAGVRATALFEPSEMLNDRQLKLITWKTHIPKCGFFI